MQANVLVNSEHLAVITDFGSARRLTQHDPNKQMAQVHNKPQPFQASFCTSSKTITLTGNNYTLRWAAPEVLSDDEMSLWSDIWAFGWIAYEVNLLNLNMVAAQAHRAPPKQVMTNSIPFEEVPADTVVVARVINGD